VARALLFASARCCPLLVSGRCVNCCCWSRIFFLRQPDFGRGTRGFRGPSFAGLVACCIARGDMRGLWV
jgi:hypothetical protein